MLRMRVVGTLSTAQRAALARDVVRLLWNARRTSEETRTTTSDPLTGPTIRPPADPADAEIVRPHPIPGGQSAPSLSPDPG
jgi:hypothetical protein